MMPPFPYLPLAVGFYRQSVLRRADEHKDTFCDSLRSERPFVLGSVHIGQCFLRMLKNMVCVYSAEQPTPPNRSHRMDSSLADSGLHLDLG